MTTLWHSIVIKSETSSAPTTGSRNGFRFATENALELSSRKMGRRLRYTGDC